MISKELLSEVLKKEYNHIEQYCNVICCRNMINEELHDGWDINIYELANKCKEWASKKDLYIMSFVSYATQGMGEATVYDVDGKLKTFTEDKEYIAIFRACEWILKDKR